MPTVDWRPDRELAGFVEATLPLPDDYDGPASATLVRNDPLIAAPKGAVLYIHGFIDYFFQAHVAAAFNEEAYNFYAIDLRKYGRSLGQARHPNFCYSVSEYFPEISAAIALMIDEGHRDIVLYGHSTGALTASIYAARGDRRHLISKLLLNSPFLDFKESPAAMSAAKVLGKAFPFLTKSNAINRWYGPSLHADYRGEWRFNTAWKPIDGFKVYFGWIRAVASAHEEVRNGLGLGIPVLLMRSDKSLGNSKIWKDEFHYADLILDVEDMRRLAGKLGSQVTLTTVARGKHDLTLSVPDVRAQVLTVMRQFVR